jgi:hypothetical protein
VFVNGSVSGSVPEFGIPPCFHLCPALSQTCSKRRFRRSSCGDASRFTRPMTWVTLELLRPFFPAPVYPQFQHPPFNVRLVALAPRGWQRERKARQATSRLEGVGQPRGRRSGLESAVRADLNRTFVSSHPQAPELPQPLAISPSNPPLSTLYTPYIPPLLN